MSRTSLVARLPDEEVRRTLGEEGKVSENDLRTISTLDSSPLKRGVVALLVFSEPVELEVQAVVNLYA